MELSRKCKRKFGVNKITRWNLDLICKECGYRAGLHYDCDCPKIDIETGKLLKVKVGVLK